MALRKILKVGLSGARLPGCVRVIPKSKCWSAMPTPLMATREQCTRPVTGFGTGQPTKAGKHRVLIIILQAKNIRAWLICRLGPTISLFTGCRNIATCIGWTASTRYADKQPAHNLLWWPHDYYADRPPELKYRQGRLRCRFRLTGHPFQGRGRLPVSWGEPGQARGVFSQ